MIRYLSIAVVNANLAMDFREWLGGEEKINEYCRDVGNPVLMICWLLLRPSVRVWEAFDDILHLPLRDVEHSAATLRIQPLVTVLLKIREGKVTEMIIWTYREPEVGIGLL